MEGGGGLCGGAQQEASWFRVAGHINKETSTVDARQQP